MPCHWPAGLPIRLSNPCCVGWSILPVSTENACPQETVLALTPHSFRQFSIAHLYVAAPLPKSSDPHWLGTVPELPSGRTVTGCPKCASANGVRFPEASKIVSPTLQAFAFVLSAVLGMYTGLMQYPPAAFFEASAVALVCTSTALMPMTF